ncbi:hypothetical protein SSTU70S_00682 [Stutzerimonas stutzeri]
MLMRRRDLNRYMQELIIHTSSPWSCMAIQGGVLRHLGGHNRGKGALPGVAETPIQRGTSPTKPLITSTTNWSGVSAQRNTNAFTEGRCAT